MRTTAQDRVRRAYTRIAEVDRPEVWITLRPQEESLAEAAAVDAAVGRGEHLPLAGTVAAVKDNIDVEGMPTTAACPAFSFRPDADAPVVARLRAAGAVVLGKTNLDQFATGLVGTRSPYGPVRDARRPAMISGGSSSGSAVAVALGLVDVALGTDTAGSGRVPAAFQGIVGIKPTRGLLPLTGVVPTDRQRDCVSVFTAGLGDGLRLAAQLAGPDGLDPLGRDWPPDAPTGLRAPARVGVALPEQLAPLTAQGLAAYQDATVRLAQAGASLVPVDITAFVEAARLLYDGSFVAARYASVGEFVDTHPDGVDPTVRAVVSAARELSAHDLVADEERLAALARTVAKSFDGIDALVLPTAPRQPSIAEVATDPLGENSRLGVFTNFCNLLDLCAVAVPAGTADGGAFGITFFGPAFHDGVVSDVAAAFCDEGRGGPFRPEGIPLAVFGAHLAGQPLNHQLEGGRLVGPVATAATYRMFALATSPPKPGLVAVSDGGGAIDGELWSLPPARIAALLAGLAAPMALGPVCLEDGRLVTGFLCQGDATENAEDITAWRSWPAYLKG